MAWASKLSDAQMRLARRISEGCNISISQVVKALERREDERIEAWKAQLDANSRNAPSGASVRGRPPGAEEAGREPLDPASAGREGNR